MVEEHSKIHTKIPKYKDCDPETAASHIAVKEYWPTGATISKHGALPMALFFNRSMVITQCHDIFTFPIVHLFLPHNVDIVPRVDTKHPTLR